MDSSSSNNIKFAAPRAGWQRIIVFSAVIGLLIGGAWWFWQNRLTTNAESGDQQIVTGTIERPAIMQKTMPVVLNNDLPETDRQLESLGDKLAEASFHLRAHENELARQTLTEADKIALTTDDDRVHDHFDKAIKHVQNEITGAKVKEADQEIIVLLNQLNMPEN